MATTSSNLVAGKVLAGQGGGGKHNKGRAAGLVATAALGLSLMVGGFLGQGRQATQSAEAPASGGSVVSDTHVASVWDFREDRRVEANDLFLADQFTYQEDRRAGAAAEYAPDTFTYREDLRPVTSVTFAADQFTYREDLRVDLQIAPAPRLDWATILFIEKNQLWEITSPASGACQSGEFAACDR